MQAQPIIVQDLYTNRIAKNVIVPKNSTLQSVIRKVFLLDKTEPIFTIRRQNTNLGPVVYFTRTMEETHLNTNSNMGALRRRQFISKETDNILNSVKPIVEQRAIAFAQGIKNKDQNLPIVRQSHPIKMF